MLRCDYLVAAVIGTFRSSLFQCIVPLVVRCRTVLPLLCFLVVGQPCFRNFYSTIPVDVVRVKSYVNRLLFEFYVFSYVVNPLYFSIKNGRLKLLLFEPLVWTNEDHDQ